MAILGVDQCGEPHRSLADPDYMGMLLTTSAVHGDRMKNVPRGCQARDHLCLCSNSHEAEQEITYYFSIKKDWLDMNDIKEE